MYNSGSIIDSKHKLVLSNYERQYYPEDICPCCGKKKQIGITTPND